MEIPYLYCSTLSMQNAVVGLMLVGERTELSFHNSIELIQKQRQQLNGIFSDYTWALNAMHFILTKPRVLKEEEEQANEGIRHFFSPEETAKRTNSVMECRWQAARILDVAPKLASNALYYLQRNRDCEEMYGSPGGFLTPKGKRLMMDHYNFSLYLQERSKFVLSSIFP